VALLPFLTGGLVRPDADVAGALAVVSKMETLYPRCSIFWGGGRTASPQPGFCARHRAGTNGEPPLYGGTAEDLITTLDADMARRATLSSWCQ
jgi:hypothetical protein